MLIANLARVGHHHPASPPRRMFIPFKPPPETALLPAVLPSPFGAGRPHPLAERAATETQAWLEHHEVFAPARWQGPLGGKMMGVLVVRDAEDRVGYLRGFAGTVGRRWLVDGFVPPVFDTDAFHAIWDDGGDEVSRLDAATRARREDARQGGARGQTAALEHAATTARERQREFSRAIHGQIEALYRFPNARGESAGLRELFDPHSPPGGSGDCAAPKLLSYALQHRLAPLALAEFWWGGIPRAGGRHHGLFYPACRGRCGTILPFMLEGLVYEPPPDVGLQAMPADAPETIFEDDAMIVVCKPSGMLSVPGRGPSRQDCVERRVQARCGLEDPTWPRMVHRLDLATSGLLIAPKHREAYVHIQRQFAARTIQKEYVALVHGVVQGDRGVIDFPIGRDLADRPRQQHDPQQGKPSLTHWQVLARGSDHTRVAFTPKTGRTHQLRVHAAHPDGLDAPIVGDRLYGLGGDRLMLHAERLRFIHPDTDNAVEFFAPAPF